MNKGKVVLNKPVIISLLKSKEVAEVVRKEASAYGDEIEKEFRGTDRYHIFVKEGNKR